MQGHSELPHPDVGAQRKVLCTVYTECPVGVKCSEWEEGSEQRGGHAWSSGMKENVVSVKDNVAVVQKSGAQFSAAQMWSLFLWEPIWTRGREMVSAVVIAQ